jgi:hypothetical protein
VNEEAMASDVDTAKKDIQKLERALADFYKKLLAHIKQTSKAASIRDKTTVMSAIQGHAQYAMAEYDNLGVKDKLLKDAIDNYTRAIDDRMKRIILPNWGAMPEPESKESQIMIQMNNLAKSIIFPLIQRQEASLKGAEFQLEGVGG